MRIYTTKENILKVMSAVLQEAFIRGHNYSFKSKYLTKELDMSRLSIGKAISSAILLGYPIKAVTKSTKIGRTWKTTISNLEEQGDKNENVII